MEKLKDKVLLTFAGRMDIQANPEFKEEGPIITLLKERKERGEEDFSTVVIFIPFHFQDKYFLFKESLEVLNLQTKLIFELIPEIKDPTDYIVILKNLRKKISKLENVGVIGEDKEIYILVNPGTPQMHASWILLVANEEIKAQIINLRDPKKEGFKEKPYSIIDLKVPDFPINWVQWKKYAIETAISAILSRNFSHHIGSHILPRAGIGQIEQRLKKLNSWSTECEDQSFIVRKLREHLDQYIQKRGDFNAELATQPLLSTRQAKIFSEVLTGFITNTLIIDNIGANEGLRYGSMLNSRIKFNFLYNKKPLKIIFTHSDCPYNNSFTHLNFPYCGCCPDCNEELSQTYIENGYLDPLISLPGMLGEQALYAFLENFIRNGIKHNRALIEQNPQLNFEVTINISEPEDKLLRNDYYLLEIWDNFTNPNLRISNSEVGEKSLFDYLKNLLNQPLVNQDGSIRKAGWGLAEMQITATILRGSKDFMNMKENLHINVKNIEEIPRLVYSLYLMKPKGIAIVTDKFKKDMDIENYKGRVHFFYNLNQLEEELMSSKNFNSYQFIIVEKSDIDLINLLKIRNLLPTRVIISTRQSRETWYNRDFLLIHSSEILKILNSDIESIEDKIWKLWIEGLLNKKGLDSAGLVLFFQQEKNEEPTKSWIEKANVQDNNKLKLTVMYKGEMKNEIAGDFSSNLLVYDRHFGAYSSIPRDRIIFHEAYDKGSADFTMIFQPFISDKIIFELIESALIKVVLVDERIAEFCHEEMNIENYAVEAYGSKKRIDVCFGAGILIITHMNINGITLPIHKNVEGKMPAICLRFDSKIEDKYYSDFAILHCKDMKCNTCKGTKIDDLDVIVIHQGLIDNLIFRGIDSRMLINTIVRKIPHIFIDSGRGLPQNIEKNVKFIPYSFLESHVMGEKIAKHRLVNSLMTMTFRAQ